MAERLDEFQKFRAELNEEILDCEHLGMMRGVALDHRAYEPARWTLRPRNCSA
ncbi:MAG: hypothetical protein WAM58_08410 [Candidatus Acidiferrum sp.]